MKLFEAVPSKLLLQTILVRGGAFRADYDFFGEGKKSRIFVVCNLNPTKDKTILLLTATTQVAKRTEHHKDRAEVVLVPLDPSTCDGITEPCVLDCESWIRRKIADFKRGVENRDYKPLSTFAPAIMGKIVAAVRQSRTLSAAEKKLILGEQPR